MKDKKVIIVYPSFVGVLPNVVLTKVERKEVDDTVKKIKKIKLPKECYFEGFKESKD